jgi:WD40 repeat protein
MFGHLQAPSQAKIHPDRTDVVLSVGQDGSLRCWDTRARVEAFHQSLGQPCTDFSLGAPGHTMIAVACGDGVTFVDVRRPGSVLGRFAETHCEPVSCVTCTGGDGYEVLTGSEDGTIALFDSRIATEDDALMTVLREPIGSGIRSAGVFGPDNGGAWAVSHTNTLTLWSWSSGDVVASFNGASLDEDEGESGKFLLGCFFDHSSGGLTCVGGEDEAGDVLVYNVRLDSFELAGRLSAPGQGHVDSVRCVDWIAGSGGTLSGCVSGGEDGRLCLWGGVLPAVETAGLEERPVEIRSAGSSASTAKAKKSHRVLGKEEHGEASLRERRSKKAH